MPPTLFERLASRGIRPPIKSTSGSSALQEKGSSSRASLLPLADSAVASTHAQKLEDAADIGLHKSSRGSSLPDQRKRGRSSGDLAKERTPRKRKLQVTSSPRACRFATPQNRKRAKGLGERQGKSSSVSLGSPRGLRFSSTLETCEICCDSVAASEAVRFRCSHGWYCRSCVSRHVEARLDNGTVRQSCPECDEELVERDLKRIVPQELMDRLLTRSLEQAVASIANLRSCPTPNCPMRVALEADDSGQFTCSICHKECCLRCGAQPYHKRLTCAKYAERMNKQNRRCSFMKWMKATGSKQCPSCSMAVTKDDLTNQSTQASECHKMLCRNCGTRFCFKCLAILSESYSCGCTKDEHGFVDPHTGKFVRHLKQKAGKPKARNKENQNSQRAPGH